MHEYFEKARTTFLVCGKTRVYLTSICMNCGIEISFLEGSGAIDDSDCPAAPKPVAVKDVNPTNHPFIDF